MKNREEFDEKISNLIYVLKKDKDMREQLLRFSKLPRNVREAELQKIILKMQEDNFDQNTIEIFNTLINDDVFNGIIKTIHADKQAEG